MGKISKYFSLLKFSITHPKEGKNLMNNNYRELLAKGIAEGIERYLSHK